MTPHEAPQNNPRSQLRTALVLAGRVALTLVIAVALFGMLNRVWAAGVTGGSSWWSSAGPSGSGFNTPTPTGTWSTNTPTRTVTPTATQALCGANSNYQTTTGVGTVVPGTTDTGNHTDDGDTLITLPFAYALYDQAFSSVNVSSNGRLDFVTVNEGGVGGYTNTCLPAAPNVGPYDYTIFAYWDDMLTTNSGYGIFTSVSGVAPNRIFNIEWRAQYFPGGGTANFEARLYENQHRFDIVYGTLTQGNTSATSGVQRNGTVFTQYFCNSSGGAASGLVTYTQPSCTPTVTPTATATATPTPCTLNFNDVQSSDFFYTPVLYLGCHGAISGYADGTFRPYNLTTRGQLAKIIVLAKGWTIYTPPYPTFQDVPTTDTFYQYIETAYYRGIISGYGCGAGCLEYRPGNNITRGQLCKIAVLAQTWSVYTPTYPTFQDVPTTDTFYGYIETAYSHGIISGYDCGAGCLEFRPGNNATRGQICKIVYQAITNP